MPQQTANTFEALAAAEKWSESERPQRLAALREYVARLGQVSPSARKLLSLVAEQSAQEMEHEAFMPRLHEACGLGVDELYGHLRELVDAELARIDGQYPFEKVELLAEADGWCATAALARLADKKNISMREALGELDLSWCD